MSGERSDRFLALANRAAERLVSRISMVEDRFGPLGGEDALTLDEIRREFEERGHLAPEDGCTSPTCEKARRLVANAMLAVFGQQGEINGQ